MFSDVSCCVAFDFTPSSYPSLSEVASTQQLPGAHKLLFNNSGQIGLPRLLDTWTKPHKQNGDMFSFSFLTLKCMAAFDGILSVCKTPE